MSDVVQEVIVEKKNPLWDSKGMLIAAVLAAGGGGSTIGGAATHVFGGLSETRVVEMISLALVEHPTKEEMRRAINEEAPYVKDRGELKLTLKHIQEDVKELKLLIQQRNEGE